MKIIVGLLFLLVVGCDMRIDKSKILRERARISSLEFKCDEILKVFKLKRESFRYSNINKEYQCESYIFENKSESQHYTLGEDHLDIIYAFLHHLKDHDLKITKIKSHQKL